MKKITLFLFPLFLLINFSSFGEGTAQLNPPAIPVTVVPMAATPVPQCNPALTILQVWDKTGRNSFSYGAPADKRLYFHIADFNNERIYLGMRRATGNLHYRIYRPDGVLLVASTPVPTAGAGFINTYAEAVYGPDNILRPDGVAIGTSGYTPSIYAPTMNGDYWIEFNEGLTANTTTGRPTYFDLSVANISGVTPIVINGQLFSQSWDLNTNGSANPFCGIMYPYTPDRITLGVDFNDIQPYGFVVNMNSFGTLNTGNSATDRLSRGGDFSLPQYPIFLNNPDSIVYPTGRIPDLTISDVEARDCGEYVVRVEINAAGFVEALLDLSPPVGYQPGTRDVLLNGGFVPDPVAPATTSTVYIPWNGLDGLGTAVPQGEVVSFTAYVQSGLTHLPLFDVEDHPNGFEVSLVRPQYDIGGTFVPAPNLFWDDRTLLGAGETRELNGAVSPAHTWTNEDNDTRNTWFYIRRVEQTSTFQMDNLDFAIADNGATGVCTPGQDNDFDQITFTVTINPNKYTPAQLSYSTLINNTPTYNVNFVSVDATGATYTDADGLPRRDILVTYNIEPVSETNEIDFDFNVTGNTVPACPAALTDDINVICDNILLPITLLDFNARHYSDNSVLVDWQTISEKDNKGFYVQRSINGKDFQDLIFVEGRGTTSNRVSYEFVDEEYWSGTAYYRLKQVDTNGETNLTRTVSIERNFTNLPFVLYPNPNRAGGELNLRGIMDKSSIKNLRVVSITGQQILVNPALKTTFDGISIDLPQTMAKGIYVIQFVTEFGMQNYKFVIE